MAIVNTSISAPKDGTYVLPNSIIGQLKTILQNDTNVAIISDNDPANTTMRVLVYSIASQNHYVKFATTSDTQITVYLLAIDGSTALASQTLPSLSTYSYTVRFLYNSKAHMIVITRASSVCLLFWAVDIGDASNGWCFKKPGNARDDTCYVHANDKSAAYCHVAYDAFDQNGKFIGIPVRFNTSGNYLQHFHPYAYGANPTTSPIGFLSDGTYTYLSDGYVVIADRVPS
jgi:hypothetical protein